MSWKGIIHFFQWSKCISGIYLPQIFFRIWDKELLDYRNLNLSTNYDLNNFLHFAFSLYIQDLTLVQETVEKQLKPKILDCNINFYVELRTHVHHMSYNLNKMSKSPKSSCQRWWWECCWQWLTFKKLL